MRTKQNLEYDDFYFDEDYQKWCLNQKLEHIMRLEEHMRIEDEAYDIMAKQHFNDKEEFERVTNN